MKHVFGQRYRIDLIGDSRDGAVGVLEHSNGFKGWLLMNDGQIHAVPLDCLRSGNVLQSLPEHVTASHYVRVFPVLTGAEV